MSKNISKMEVYLQKELKEKTGQLIFFTLLLLIPNLFVKTAAILLISSSLLAYDIKHKNAELLYLLPFSKKELYLYNFVYLTLTVTATSVISQIFAESDILSRLVFQLNSLTLLFSIFGITMLFSALGRNGFVWATLMTILDAVLGGLGSRDISASNFNPYNLISFTHQGNAVLSFLTSCLICLFSYLTFVRKGGEN
ncbi:MAG: hypothetical protein GX094_07285 [Clostridiales bacterium]|nr:hypothetical protein [Clostridiales bacterium]